MQLPEGMENRKFTEWNCLVCGLMQAWEIARSRGVERQLEKHLQEDGSGVLTELLGRLGYVCSAASAVHGHGPWPSDRADARVSAVEHQTGGDLFGDGEIMALIGSSATPRLPLGRYHRNGAHAPLERVGVADGARGEDLDDEP